MPNRKFSLEERVWILQEFSKTQKASVAIQAWPFPSPLPNVTTFPRLAARFHSRGNVCVAKGPLRKQKNRNPFSVAKTNVVDAHLTTTSKTSIFRSAAVLGMKPSTFRYHRKLSGFKPYHPTWVQELKPGDYVKRTEFCKKTQLWLRNHKELVKLIWWSDEATFNLNGTVNRHNCCYYAKTNPKIVQPVQMKSPGITVWAAVSCQGIIGPYFFDKENQNGEGPTFTPCTVNSNNYVKMLQEYFYPRLLHCFDFSDQIFMQDGASPHFGNIVRNYLNETFGSNWIGRGLKRFGIAWPPRSPDLTPCDYGLWGFIREKVYSKNVTNLAELKQAISDAFKELTPEYFQKLCGSVTRRWKTCLRVNGGQVPKADKENKP